MLAQIRYWEILWTLPSIRYRSGNANAHVSMEIHLRPERSTCRLSVFRWKEVTGFQNCGLTTRHTPLSFFGNRRGSPLKNRLVLFSWPSMFLCFFFFGARRSSRSRLNYSWQRRKWHTLSLDKFRSSSAIQWETLPWSLFGLALECIPRIGCLRFCKNFLFK